MRAEHEEHRPPAHSLPADELRALRATHPEARVTTALIRLDEGVVVVSAELVLPSGAQATALGSAETTLPRSVELAESRAVARALTGLGFAPSSVVRDTASQTTPVVTTTPAPHAVPAPVVTTTPLPRPAATAPPQTTAAPITTRPPQPRPETIAEPIGSADDPPIEDYSWTAFWNWARGHGYANKADLEQKLGISITGMSPADVRVLIRERVGLN